MISQIKKIVTGRLRQNCYVAVGRGRDAIIIDPGADEEDIIGFLESESLRIIAILNTHAHYDHVGAVAALMKKYGAPFYLNGDDERTLRSANIFSKMFDTGKHIEIPGITHDLRELPSSFSIGEFLVTWRATPGHSPGGCCFLIEDQLFTGDTLMRGAVGRTDLPGGDAEALRTSLVNLVKLPMNLTIHPGHGQSSSLGQECTDNPYLLDLAP